MPQGVEHQFSLQENEWNQVVSQPLMPQGVEHDLAQNYGSDD